jgi:capsular polysaccharide biosynthesis protein
MLDSEIKSLRDLMGDLQGKWGEVRMNEMADDRVSNIIVLTEPELVMALGGGKTAIYMIMMVVLALALGIVGAFVAESVDHRVYIPREVEEKLKLPVFASVPKAD